jgi:uncharacterized protein
MNNKMKQWFINQSINHPKRSIFISVVLTLLVASGLRFVEMEDDMLKLLPDDIESTITWDAVQEEFGNTNLMFVAYGRRDQSVYNADILSTLFDFSQALEDLPQVDEVISIATLNRMDSDDGFMEISDLQPYRDLSPDEINDIKQYLLKTPDMERRVVGTQGDFLNVVIRPVVDVATDKFRNNVVDISQKYLSEYEFHFGGETYLTGTIPAMMRADVSLLMRVGLIIMVIILLSSLRSIPAVLMVMSVIALSLAAMMGFMGWILHLTGSDIFYFSLLNTSMPIILLTIANSDSVHMITKFFKKMRQTGNVENSVRGTMNSLMLPIFLTSVTTIVAFLSLVLAPLSALIGYGLTIGFGIAWAWFLSSTFLPSIMYLKKWNLNSKAISTPNFLENIVDYFGRLVTIHPKRVLSAGIGIIVIGIIGLFLLKIEVNVITFFERGTEIRESLEFMDNEMTGTMDLQFRIKADMKSPENLNTILDLQNFIETNPAVSTTISIADIIKQMHRTVMDDDPAFETIPESQAKVNNLFTLYSMSGDPDDFSGLVDYDYETGLTTALMKNISTTKIIEFVEKIRKYVNDNFSPDIAVTITGMLVVLNDIIHLLIQSSFISIFVSISLITIMACLFFKRFLWGILAVVPLSSAVILTFGFMGIFGIHLSHVTAILSSIIIGVGVDFAIHYISQFKNIVNRQDVNNNISQLVVNEVGYPIVLDAGSNMAFGALLFSTFLPVTHIGGLMVFAMISTAAGTLTLLAASTELLKNKLKKIG